MSLAPSLLASPSPSSRLRGRIFWLTLSCLLALSALSVGAEELASPYAGKADVSATGVLPNEVKALTEGSGMALALPAEVNGYPGPRHLLDAAAAGQIDLTGEQLQTLGDLFTRMHAEAVAKGTEILDAEAHLALRFRHRHIDPGVLAELVGEIGRLRSDLRLIHLRTHLETRALLSPEQLERYRSLRGYGEPEHTSHHGH